MVNSSIDTAFNHIIVLALVGLIPLVLMVTTSFIKISIVLSLIRNALGVQQLPPNMALYAVAMLLTIFIMYPVGISVFERAYTLDLSIDNFDEIRDKVPLVLEPYRQFLMQHTSDEDKIIFLRAAENLWPDKHLANISENNLLVLIPAFIVTEMTEAFKIGFLIYLPFLVIDLIVSNILLALGMMMVAPMTISLPFKLLLFVMVNGWSVIMEGLVLSYVV